MGLLTRLRLAETKPRPDTAERGSNAVSYQYGGASRLRDPEYKYELSGRQGGWIYQRMRLSDPHIAGLRRAQNLPLLRASVDIEPADREDKDAVAKAELVKRLLLKDFPWRSFLSDTCLCMDYGFAPFEIIWTVRDKEVRCRLALRPADSIAAQDIEVAEGKVTQITQRPETGGTFVIPGDKLLWFCHDKEGDTFTGRPILRAMYKPWKIKEDNEIQLSELSRKLGGIPDITTQGEPSAELAAALDAAAESFGVSAGGFFRHDDTVTVRLLTGNARISEVLGIIKERNEEITSVCQAQVFDLGTSNAGSRALGTTLSDLFSSSVQAMASYREDILNATDGLIHQLVSYNFPNDDNRPSLRFGNVQQADMRAFAQAMYAFSQAFGTLDEETQDWARQQLNMPEGKTEQVQVPATAPFPPQQAAPEAPDEPDDDVEESGAQASEAHAHVHGLQLAERRAPQGVEVYLDLAEITATFDTAKTAVKDATAATREKLTAELVKRARVAAATGKLAKFSASAPPMVDRLTADILAVLSDFYSAGRKQVSRELQRQRDGRPWSAQSIRAAEVMGYGEPSPEGLRALKAQAEALGRAIALAIQAEAGMQAGRLAAGTPIDDATMLTMATRVSDAAALRFVGTASDFMAMGRTDEAGAQAQDVEDAVYSALLDGAVCSECAPMDGQTTTDLAEAATWTPNPMCEGGGRCRCLTVFQIRQGGSA